MSTTLFAAHNYTIEEARGFLRMIQKMVGRLSDTMYKNVYHYLIGDYRPEHHASMFGAPGDYASDGIGHFWENVLEGRRANSLWYNDVRFANNDGANFQNYRSTALRMFREQFPPRRR